MKKLFFGLVVAMATLSFTACDKTDKLTDEQLKQNILSNATYVGLEASDAVTLTFNSAEYILSYDELGVYSKGTWVVSQGGLILTGVGLDEDGSPYNNLTGTIAKEGKELTLQSGTLTFSVKKK
jgi:hypothetical protein